MISKYEDTLIKVFKDYYDQAVLAAIPSLPFINPKICSLCKMLKWIHDKEDHPFFYDNLEYLEWKCLQKEMP
jgi:hypothetical protein